MEAKHTVNRAFPATRWTLVARASSEGAPERDQALEELCRSYWPPVYAFVRSKGVPPAEAEDLTQGFFASILQRNDLSRASSDRGKLRTFLLGAVKNFLANDWRDRNRLKRGGDAQVVSFDSAREDGTLDSLEPVGGDTPETIFDRQWALTVLRQVLEKLEERYEEKGQGSLFSALRFVISPGSEGQSYAEIATAEGMSESAVKVAAHRLRERYGRLLHETIADTLTEDGDVAAELRELMGVF